MDDAVVEKMVVSGEVDPRHGSLVRARCLMWAGGRPQTEKSRSRRDSGQRRLRIARMRWTGIMLDRCGVAGSASRRGQAASPGTVSEVLAEGRREATSNLAGGAVTVSMAAGVYHPGPSARESWDPPHRTGPSPQGS